MFVALHIDVNNWSRVLGIWVAPEGREGFPESFYPAPGDGYEHGLNKMKSKGPNPTWRDWFCQLEDRSSYASYWSAMGVQDGPVAEVYDQLRQLVHKNATTMAREVSTGQFTTYVPGVSSTVTPNDLAERIGGPTHPMKISGKLLTAYRFFADETRLLMYVRPQVDQTTADMALMSGLAMRKDQQLLLLIPTQLAAPTQGRVPWIVPAVRVFTYVDGEVDEPAPLTQAESITSYRRSNDTVPAELGAEAEWVRPLVEWVRTVPGIEALHRKNYVSWQLHGRQVLRATPGPKRLRVVAGVDTVGPFHGKDPVKVTLTSPASDHEILRLIAATAAAAADRLEGVDAKHPTLRLQGLLHPHDLGLVSWRRQVPSWRPGLKRSSFVDFLGCDSHGRAHIIETRIGPDPTLVLRALDDWLWFRANHTSIAGPLGITRTDPPMITMAVAPKAKGGTDALATRIPAQVEALHRDVPWRFATIDDPITASPVTVSRPYSLPNNVSSGKHQRWAVRLHEHLVAQAATTGLHVKNRHTYANPFDGLIPAALDACHHLHAQNRLHDYIGHVRSSQAFALNLLAPLTLEVWTLIARYLLGHDECDVTEAPEFEYFDPTDALGETTKASPHATQVDCLVRVRLDTGRKHLLLIEVKLSEDTFSTCSAYTSPRNPRKHICTNPLPFGGNPAECFQLTNHDREHRRRYDDALHLPEATPTGFGCWFRNGARGERCPALIVAEVRVGTMLQKYLQQRPRQVRIARLSGSITRAAPVMMVSELLERWLAADHPWKPSTVIGYRSNAKALQADCVLASMRVVSLTPRAVRAAFAWWSAAGDGTAVIGGRFRTLRAAIGWAYDERIIDVHPIRTMRGPSRPQPRRPLDRETLGRLLAAAESQLIEAVANDSSRPGALDHRHLAEQDLLLVRLAAETGARRGEIAALQFDDLRDRTLQIARAVSADIITTPKSGRSRTLTVGTVTAALWHQFEREWRSTSPSSGPFGPWLFSANLDHRTRLTAGALGHRFARLAQRGGAHGATLHRLRHNVATFLVEQGQVLQAQARLGHADAATTLREYSYALPSGDATVADAIDRHLDSLMATDVPSSTLPVEESR